MSGVAHDDRRFSGNRVAGVCDRCLIILNRRNPPVDSGVRAFTHYGVAAPPVSRVLQMFYWPTAAKDFECGDRILY